MGKAIHDAFPDARAVFEVADRALGLPLSRICFEGPEEALRLTATTQPAVLTTSLAILAAMRSRLAPSWTSRIVCAAGHSLGEYTALVAAGALDLEDALRAVRRRGEYMQEAVPAGQGAMAAVLGATLEEVESLCREAAGDECLVPANLNAPDQTVVAGTAAAVGRLGPLARERGVRKVVPLPVSAPFHCPLMAPAQARLASDLKRLPLRHPDFPIITNVSARPEHEAEALREALVQQVSAPVRWVEVVRRIQTLGADLLLEVGPGRVLTGLARRIAPELTALNIDDPRSLEATLDVLGRRVAARSSG